MLDGQGCLLPVRHFRTEDTLLILSSCAGLYKTCHAESSAESNPNPSAYPHSRSEVSCPCLLDASESNHGDLVNVNLSKSVACHCLPIPLSKVEPVQTWDSNGDLAAMAVPSVSSEFDCSSTGYIGSLSPAEEVEAVTWSIDGELDEVGTGPCTFDCRSLEFGRSVEDEVRCDRIASRGEMQLAFVDAKSISGVDEQESVRKCGDRVSICGADKSEGLCKWKNAEVPECKDVMCEPVDDEHTPGLGCINTSFKDSKEAEESSSQSACTEEILLKESTPESSVTNCASSVYVCATGCKRLQIANRNSTCGGSRSLCGHRKMPHESHNDDANDQHQPYLRGLDDESALRCFAFVPLSDIGRLSMLGRQYRDLVRSRLIFKLRRTYGVLEHLVFIYTSGPGGWTAYDAKRNEWRTLPQADVNPSFISSDKESLSAGTHVLWFGKEMFDFVYYRYDLLTNSWQRGPSMVNPRCLFASASCGEFAYVAGGFGPANDTGALTLLNSAERYNSVSGEWADLPPMSIPRHKCAGFFMDGKFYVIGGRDANHQPIMSGEEYNPATGLWRTISNMYFAPEVARRDLLEPSPPLVAVVNNQLYAVENTTNILKMYNKHSNTWTNLGYLPVRADLRNGWGVAFKALGDRLFVMGDLDGIAACCWQPGPNANQPLWHLLCRQERGVGCFLFNCAVMAC